jgi:hypothetical protein
VICLRIFRKLFLCPRNNDADRISDEGLGVAGGELKLI